ncbi:DUF397 domain-containing protein [Streptomyces sp. NBC_01187]|uniref:DUF397 domain-containing protein n=1 Tax=Streptomyces sp. NBC_01187 TaxID=2903766 RepID=UPI00386BF150|nr:DUF397 domain-containing protein [Streptomyces sp. NBC_01187]
MTVLKGSSGDGVGLEWMKSSYSDNDGPDCVEVAATPGTVHVRDSKDAAGPQLGFGPGVWADFVSYAATR